MAKTYYQTAIGEPEKTESYYCASEKEFITPQQAAKLTNLSSFEFFYYSEYLDAKSSPFWETFDVICQLPKLKNMIVRGYEDSPNFWKMLKKAHNLELLQLKYPFGKLKYPLVLEDLFENFPKLRFLNIELPIGLHEIPLSLWQLPQLENLHLYIQNFDQLGGNWSKVQKILKNLSPYLKYLYFHIDGRQSKDNMNVFVETILQNIHIEKLSFNNHSGYFKPEISETLEKGKGLRTLAIQNQNIQKLPVIAQPELLKSLILEENNLEHLGAEFSSLESLSLNNNPNLDFEKVLNQINPKKLEYLWVGACKIKDAPERLVECTQLKQLYLSYNKLETLPVGMYKLEHLEILNIGGSNQVSKTTEMKTGKPFLTLLKNFAKLKLSEESKQIQTALFVGNQTFLNKKTPAELVEGCLQPAHNSIERNLIMFLEKKLPSPLKELDTTQATFAFFGSWTSISIKDLKDFCKKNNVGVADLDNPKVTHICIGETFKKADINALKQTKQPWVMPLHLKQWMEEKETPFLKQLDEGALQNLEGLLKSGDQENQKLALSMMISGGIPNHLLYTVVLVSLRNINFHKLLQKYVDAELYTTLSRVRVKRNFSRILNSLLKTPQINELELAKAIVSFDEDYPHSNTQAITTLLKKDPQWLIDYLGRDGNLNWQFIGLNKLLSLSVDFTNITGLYIYWKDLDGKMVKLKKISNLKRIYLQVMHYEVNSDKYKGSIEKLATEYPQYEIIKNIKK